MVLTLLAARVPSQADAASSSVESGCAQLLAELDPADQRQAPDRAEQITRISAFLQTHAAADAQACVLRLRTRLGTLLLHACRFEEARREFSKVIDGAPAEQRDLPGQRDFLGRARYGRAQALELLDERADARDALQQIITLHAGERYARFAKVALERLAQQTAVGPWAGQQAPAFHTDPLLDLDERPHQLRSYADRPLLLVFWSPEVEASSKRLRTAAAAWKRGGGTMQTVLAFAMSTSVEHAQRARKQYELSMPIIVCNDEFVHPTALAYHVTKLPTVVLIGPGGAVVGRDLPAREIERIVGLPR